MSHERFEDGELDLPPPQAKRVFPGLGLLMRLLGPQGDPTVVRNVRTSTDGHTRRKHAFHVGNPSSVEAELSSHVDSALAGALRDDLSRFDEFVEAVCANRLPACMAKDPQLEELQDDTSTEDDVEEWRTIYSEALVHVVEVRDMLRGMDTVPSADMVFAFNSEVTAYHEELKDFLLRGRGDD